MRADLAFNELAPAPSTFNVGIPAPIRRNVPPLPDMTWAWVRCDACPVEQSIGRVAWKRLRSDPATAGECPLCGALREVPGIEEQSRLWRRERRLIVCVERVKRRRGVVEIEDDEEGA